MFRRAGFVVFMLCGGIFVYPIKWILMGTRGSRDRQRLNRNLEAQYRANRGPTDAERRLEEEQVRLGNWRPRR